MAEKRVASGIPGLDPIIKGGFLPNNVYLITGGTGTGKTIFCMQFIHEGLKKGERCIYFTLEEPPEDVMDDAAMFGWDLRKYIKEKKLIIEYQNPFEMADMTTAMVDKIKKFGATRVVIDSTAIFGMVFKTGYDLRMHLYELIKVLKTTNAAVLMTSEILEESKMLSRFGIEEFVVDGIIFLQYINFQGAITRGLMVRKMRRTDHGRDVYPMIINDSGVSIKKH
jgi:KaiC/GvpD/RAD55 family RecA-like ATPase